MSDRTEPTRQTVTGVETTASCAAKAGVDVSVIRRALYSGRLAGEKVGGVWLIPTDAADDWIRTRRRGRPPKRPGQLPMVEFMDVDDSKRD